MNRELTILLAEDDEHDVWFVKRALQWGDIHNPVRVVQDGEDAIAYLRGEREFANRELYPMPNLLLLDIQMPRKDGWEVLRWLRNSGENGVSRLPVIVLSSSGMQEQIDRAYELGVNAFLVKPDGFSQLVDTLKKTTDFWKDVAERPQI